MKYFLYENWDKFGTKFEQIKQWQRRLVTSNYSVRYILQYSQWLAKRKNDDDDDHRRKHKSRQTQHSQWERQSQAGIYGGKPSTQADRTQCSRCHQRILPDENRDTRRQSVELESERGKWWKC